MSYGGSTSYNDARNALRSVGGISTMLANNRDAPNFTGYVTQGSAEKTYLSQSAKVAYAPVIPKAPPAPVGESPLLSANELKNEYVIGDSKEEIIHNIIDKKASVANVRKALSKYADLIMEQDLF